MADASLTRRTVIKTTAVATAAMALPLPFVHGAHAAGALRMGFWDHWVPGANAVLEKICKDWAAKEKVDLTIDFITSQSDKLTLTIAAEAQAQSGHDVLTMQTWYASGQADNLEPMDDIVENLIKQYGNVTAVAEYLGKQSGHWIALPSSVGSQTKPPCGRIDLLKKFADLDIVKMYPAGGTPDKELVDKWTWDTFSDVAAKCFKAGYPFGMPLSQYTDSVDWVGSVFAAYGAVLVDKDGNITVKSDATKQVLEWFKKTVPSFPPDVFAWDDAGNNKALVSGKAALIMNPPSAWAVAVRDAPKVAEQCWTFECPSGPKGRFDPGLPFFWGLWKFSKNKSAAKSLLTHLMQREQVEQLVEASHGYDIPQFDKLHDFKTWAEEAPPKGTLYNYPPRGDQMVTIACAPAPTKIATQMYSQATLTKMVAHCTQGGESIDKAIDWASSELEGFMRS